MRLQPYFPDPAEEISAATIWECYGDLRKFAKDRLAGSNRLKPPTRLPRRAPRGADRQAATDLAAMVAGFRTTTPLPLRPSDFAYVFLFVQLLRVSYRHGPYYTADGWRGLAWCRLNALRGQEDRAERAWRRHYRATLEQLGRSSADDILWKYPRPQPVGNDARLARTDVQRLRELAATEGGTAVDIIRDFEVGGRVRRPGFYCEQLDWHPWVVLGWPDAWDFGLVAAPRVERALHRLIRDPEVCRAWLTFLPELTLDRARGEPGTLRAVVQRIDAYVACSADLQHAWATTRSTLRM